MICEKAFSITTVAAFAWDAAVVVPGTGAASFTPDSATGTTAVAITDTLGTATTCISQNIGTMIWNSNVAVPCNMHVIIASNGPSLDPTLVGALFINVVAPVTALLSVQAGVDINWNDTQDFPFNLPDTGGADWTIEWSHNAVTASNPTNPGNLTLTGVFTFV